MDLWAARKVFRGGYARVIDVGSRVDGYIAHVLTFRSIEVLDVRELRSPDKALIFRKHDVLNGPTPTNDADCVSCLHALEHFGLGRYGDNIDLDGWRKGLDGLVRMLRVGGALLVAVPIGRQRIEFDANRIFDARSFVKECESKGLALRSFSYIDDNGAFNDNVDVPDTAGMDYACGCFEFERYA
ncbi:MAG: DUF268 domain-containing protein [Rhodospirillaceae bacterium]